MLRVAALGLYPPARWANVFHLLIDRVGDATPAEVDEILDNFNTAWENSFLLVQSSNVQYLGCEAVYYGAAGPSRFQADGVGTGVTDTGVALPAQVAVGISWRIINSYRGGHPRSYICGAQSSMLDDVTRLNETAQEAWLLAASTFRGDINGMTPPGDVIDITLGTVSYVVDGEWRTPPVFRPYIGESVDHRVDTQRRRLGPDVAL